MTVNVRTLLPLILLLLSSKAVPMSFFKVSKAYLFSPSAITLTKAGEPLQENKVIRRWEWKNELAEDYLYTNEDGVVVFDGVVDSGINHILPVQFFVAQQLVVIVDGNEMVFWENAKMNPSKNSELGGLPLVLVCDIGAKEKTYQIDGTELHTKCTWKADDK